eukprot:7709929-Heterocapsa_arctica.AAC.1
MHVDFNAGPNNQEQIIARELDNVDAYPGVLISHNDAEIPAAMTSEVEGSAECYEHKLLSENNCSSLMGTRSTSFLTSHAYGTKAKQMSGECIRAMEMGIRSKISVGPGAKGKVS